MDVPGVLTTLISTPLSPSSSNRRRGKRLRGISLIELLVVAFFGAIVVAGATGVFRAAIDFQTNVVPNREQQLDRQRFEDGVGRLLRAAFISTDAQDATTYFIGGSSTGDPGALSQGGTSDTLIFTVLGMPPSATYMNSQDDFETRNQNFGPQGGAAEVQISTTAVGDAGGRRGLFIREQRPADGDPYQGGYESVLDSRVTSMSFEFWNGESWQTDWDTVNQGARRLPAAVRVTYAFEEDGETTHSFVVPIPLSDVTPDNPLGVGTP